MTLRELRNDKGLSQQEVAERLQVSVRSVVRWEQGERPQTRLIRRIGEAFGVNWKEITFVWKKSETTEPTE